MSSLQTASGISASQAFNHRRFLDSKRADTPAIRFRCRNPLTVAASSLNVDTAAKFGPAIRSITSKEIMEAEAKLLVGTYARAPVVLTSGKGCKLYDLEGREYLDLTSRIAVNALGHCDFDWLKALIDQAGLLTHVNNVYYSVPRVELAKSLVDSSFADRVFFCNYGTEANEAAIKFARKFQKQTVYITASLNSWLDYVCQWTSRDVSESLMYIFMRVLAEVKW